MTLFHTASAACLFIALAIPALVNPASAELCRNCGEDDGLHRHVAPDGTLRQRHEAVRAPVRKPRICYRPDAGRYSRLIPYEC